MKKLLFLLVLLILLIGCSSDDDVGAPIQEAPPPVDSYLKATIGGTEYILRKIVTETITVHEGTESYIDLHVTATNEGDESKKCDFVVEQFATGANILFSFTYTIGGVTYETDLHPDQFATNVTENSAAHTLIGTFSGPLYNFDGPTISITSGTFQTSY